MEHKHESKALPWGLDMLYRDRHGLLVSHKLRDEEYVEVKHGNRHNGDI